MLQATSYKLQASKGFSLIEILIYIAIIGTIVVSLINFSIAISNSRNKTYVVQEVHANARTALHLISQKIRAAGGINVGSSVFGSDPGILSLSVINPVLDPTIIDLDQDDGVLRITEGVSSPVSITGNEVKVTNLVFTALNPTNIRIEITVEYNNEGTDINYIYAQSLQTAASIRR